MIRLHGHSIPDFMHRHGGGPGEQFRQNALVRGVQVLDQDESHPGIGRQSPEQIGESFEAAGRCADSHDG